MIEGLVTLITLILESCLSLITASLEFIASLFVGAGKTLTALDTITLLLLLITELFVWLLLGIKEFLLSIFTLRKPRPVSKPVFWRPKSKPKIKKANNAPHKP